MTRSEFEKLAGSEVSAETYKNIIEPMYMRTDWDKATFVKKIKNMQRESEKLMNVCTFFENRKRYLGTLIFEKILAFSVKEVMPCDVASLK